jgi:hypothetical protein
MSRLGDNAKTPREEADSTQAEEEATFERLPPQLRRALCDAVIDFSAVEILASYNQQALRVGPARATHRILIELRQNEQDEIEEFAAEHLAQHGYALPHVAAGATILRSRGP